VVESVVVVVGYVVEVVVDSWLVLAVVVVVESIAVVDVKPVGNSIKFN
jgi:hypothetical protein